MDSDDDSDDWATEDLPPLPSVGNKKKSEPSNEEEDQDDAYWKVEQLEPPTEQEDIGSEEKADEGHPMVLVDMTVLSNGEIHSKFDPNAVNDPVAVKKLRKTYDEYAADTALLANRTVVPCGSTVWRAALVSLRKETPGHYWCPIFPTTANK